MYADDFSTTNIPTSVVLGTDIISASGFTINDAMRKMHEDTQRPPLGDKSGERLLREQVRNHMSQTQINQAPNWGGLRSGVTANPEVERRITSGFIQADMPGPLTPIAKLISDEVFAVAQRMTIKVNSFKVQPDQDAVFIEASVNTIVDRDSRYITDIVHMHLYEKAKTIMGMPQINDVRFAVEIKTTVDGPKIAG